MKRHIYFQTTFRTSLRSTFGMCFCSSLLLCFSLHLASRMEAKNTILTDAASSEVSGCQSMPCCWTLTFLPSVSHRTFWQSKADFRSFDYTSWIIHTPCTFILQGPGVGWLDFREYSFCQTVADIPGNSIQYIITIYYMNLEPVGTIWTFPTFSGTVFLLMILMIGGFYVFVCATRFWGQFLNVLVPNWDISTTDDRVGLPWHFVQTSVIPMKPNDFADPSTQVLSCQGENFYLDLWHSGPPQQHFLSSGNLQMLIHEDNACWR